MSDVLITLCILFVIVAPSVPLMIYVSGHGQRMREHQERMAESRKRIDALRKRIADQRQRVAKLRSPK